MNNTSIEAVLKSYGKRLLALVDEERPYPEYLTEDEALQQLEELVMGALPEPKSLQELPNNISDETLAEANGFNTAIYTAQAELVSLFSKERK